MIQFTLRADAPSAPLSTVRHLIAEVIATRPEAHEPEEQPPLDLALVLDRSGSMSGARLDAAKQAAAGVIEGLRAQDRLTLVSFESNVHVHFDSRTMDEAGRERALAAVHAIETAGATNLSGGYFAAAELLASEPLETRRKQLVLLSDGCANSGIVDPVELEERARAYLERGVTTTAVGIGDDYSPTQLAAIAENGGGRLHEAEHASEIVEVLLGELGEVSKIVVDHADLELRLPAGVTALELSGAPSTIAPSHVRVSLGSLLDGRPRRVVFRVDLSAFAESTSIEFEAKLRATSTGESIAQTEIATIVLRRDDAFEPTLADTRIVLEAWQAGLTRRVTTLNREGRFDAVREIAEDELPKFERYARRHPETHGMALWLRSLFQQAHHAMPERELKSVFLNSYKQAKGEVDVRSRTLDLLHGDLY